jgi:folylpolyglutamate synthase
MHQKTMRSPIRIGCLMSPHLSDICERIRLDSSNINKHLFATHFFNMWNEMLKICTKSSEAPNLPGYPSIMTLLAFYVFVHEKADLVILETGIGGEKDTTNIIKKPLVTGITSLGLDHVKSLGDSIESIAWHKAGIFKSGCPAFTVPQERAAMQVLLRRARERETVLKVVSEDILQRHGAIVYPDMQYQRRNASLAIQLGASALKQLDSTFEMTSALARSIETTPLPGRNEILRMKNTWFLSTAHNDMSVLETARWSSTFLEYATSLRSN